MARDALGGVRLLVIDWEICNKTGMGSIGCENARDKLLTG